MIFVPFEGGCSRCPEKWTLVNSIVLGVQGVCEIVLHLDRALS